MIFDEKTRFQIVALGLGIATVLGYGIFRATDKPKPVVTPVTDTAAALQQITVSSSEPGKPNVSVRGENIVIAGTGGHVTTVTGDPDLTYEWSIKGGTFEGDTQGTTITWMAGAGSDVVITCKATNSSGQSSVISLQAIVRQPPAIARFEAVPQIITKGSSAKLTWTISHTTSLVLDPGAIDVTEAKGPVYEVTPLESETFVLKATNSTGVLAMREALVKVVPKPEIISVNANPVSNSPDSYDVIGEFKGGKAELKNGAAVIGSGETSPMTVRVDGLKEGASLTFTVTNEAGTYVTTSLNFSAPKK